MATLQQVDVKLPRTDQLIPCPPSVGTVFAKSFRDVLISRLPIPTPPPVARTTIDPRQQYIFSLINAIVSADIPNGILLLQKFHSLYMADDRYILLFENITLLFERDVSCLQRQVLKLLLQEIFLKKTLSMPAARELFAQLAFVVTEQFPLSPLHVLCEEIKAMARRALLPIREEYRKKMADFQAIGIYSRADLRCTLLPQYMALCLLLPNGKVNAGMGSLLVEVFLSKESERDDVEKQIVNVLQDLECNKDAVRLIESIALTKRSVFGEKIINATLLRPVATAVTSIDACQVALTACLSFWRQKNGVNCSPYSILVQRQTMGLSWFVEDIKSIFESGCIKRIVQKDEVKFFGLEVSESCAVNTTFSRERMRGTWLENLLTNHLQLKKEHFDMVCEKPPETLQDVFSTLQSLWPTTYSSRALDDVGFLIEAPHRNSLLTVLENAIGSSFYVPLRVASPPPPLQKNLYLRVIDIFYQFSQMNNLVELTGTMSSALKELEQVSSIPGHPVGVFRYLSDLRVQWSLNPSSMDEDRSVPGAQTIALEDSSGIKLFNRKALASHLLVVFSRMFYETYSKAAIPPTITLSRFEEYLGQNEFAERGSLKVFGTGGVLSSIDGKAVCFQKSNAYSVKDFLAWLRPLRVTSDSRLSIPVRTKQHSFLLLPNHRSLLTAESLEAFEERSARVFDSPLASHGNRPLLVTTIKMIVDALVDRLCCGIQIIEEEWFKNISWLPAEVEEVKKHLHKKIESAVFSNISFFEFIRIIDVDIQDKIIEIVRLKEPSVEDLEKKCSFELCSEDVYYALFLGLRSCGDSRFSNLLLHFADSNYVDSLEDKQYALHYCFWVNPKDRNWRTVSACEHAHFSPEMVIAKMKIADIVVVDSLDEIQRESRKRLALMGLLRK